MRKKTIVQLATFFSVTFQPLFMPFFTVLVLNLIDPTFISSMNWDTRSLVIGYTFLFTVILPALMFLVFYKMGWISDVNLTVRKERVVPTFLTLGLFAGLFYILYTNPLVNQLFTTIFIGAVAGVLVANLITTFWKISIHALGVASLPGSFLALGIANGTFTWWIIALGFALLFTVAISRLILKRHTLGQVIAGGSLGVIAPIVAVLIS